MQQCREKLERYSCLGFRLRGLSGKTGRRGIRRVVNSRQGANSGRPIVNIEMEQKRMKQIELRLDASGEPPFLQRRKGYVNIQVGNSEGVARGRANRGGIRDCVDGSDKEQQADQPDGVFEFQSVPGSKEAKHLAGPPMNHSNIVHCMQEFRELSHEPIGSGFRTVAAVFPVGCTSCGWAIGHWGDRLPRNPAKRAGQTCGSTKWETALTGLGAQ